VRTVEGVQVMGLCMGGGTQGRGGNPTCSILSILSDKCVAGRGEATQPGEEQNERTGHTHEPGPVCRRMPSVFIPP
jgi:hypothetical protein